MSSFFTSEAVTCGHPDKVCDQVADAILDAVIDRDPDALVDCEVSACRDRLHIFGEITTQAIIDYRLIARSVLRDIGYTQLHAGFDAQTCRIRVHLHEQSGDITRSIRRADRADAGAGDQGVMFGYACDETPSLMPMPITLAQSLVHQLELARREGEVPGLRLDGKAQVSLEYDEGEPKRISAVIVSAQHDDGLDVDTLRERITEKVICRALPQDLLDDTTQIFVNPTGRFVIGGPAARAGISGRKTVSDTYGGYCRDGGGSIVGKDPSKLDRSGTYMARYLAKNIVGAGLAHRCETQLAYAIGFTDPVCVAVNTFGTGQIDDGALREWIIGNIDLRPAKIIERFSLKRPIYRALSCCGPFGTHASAMPWEWLDLGEELAGAFQ